MSEPLTKNCDSRARRRGGFVLVVVLIVIAMLTLSGYSFSELMFAEHKAVRLQTRATQSRCLAESGVELVKMYLMLADKEKQAFGGHFHNPRRFQGVIGIPPSAGEPLARFSIVSPSRIGEQPPKLRFGLGSESSRLNLRALLEWDKAQPGAARNALLSLPAMTEETADAILDWMDEDDLSRERGAEREYYEKLVPPYAPPNAVPQTLEELLWVRGVTRSLLFGDDANQNGYVEPEEFARAERYRRGPQTNAGAFGWAAYLTLHSAECARNAQGEPKIDLNQGSLEQLYDQLVRAFEPEWATFIVAYRQFGPYFGPGPATSGSPLPPDFLIPARFQIPSLLDLVGIRVQVTPPKGPPFVLPCPFPNDRGAMRDYLPKLFEQLTTSTQTVIGRVNINEAPREVLLGVPGLTAGLVEDLLAKRSREGGAVDESKRFPAWPLVEGLVELQPMKELLKYITTGGDVYRAQSVGYFDDGPQFRAEFIVDATERYPRLVSWRELERLGRGFDVAVLGVSPATEPQQPPAY